MPNLYIVQQIKRNTNKVIDCLHRTLINGWAFIDKYSTKFANGFNKEIVGRIIRKANKHKKCLKILSIILAILALISGLFMGSFKSAGSRQQGFQINYTEEVFKEKYLTNDWKYTGLNGYIKTVPKQKIFLQFSKAKTIIQQQEQNYQLYDPIEARVIEGTKLIVEASLQCSIVIGDNKDKNLKLFFDTYGFRETPGKEFQLQWMTYLRQKVTNLIVQTIAKQSFYSITIKELKQSINSQFGSVYERFNATFPFKISLVSLTINYPEISFSANKTLGSELLRKKSLLNQVNNQYQSVGNYILNNSGGIKKVYEKNAELESQIDKGLIKVYSFEGWTKGLDMVKKITDASSTNQTTNSLTMQKFFWLYFNSLYNSTYKSSILSPNSTFSLNSF